MASEQGSELLSEFDASIEQLPGTVDRAAIERMRTVAYVLDSSVRVPGTEYRIGIDPVLGALPVAGDVVSGALSLYIVLEATRLGVSYTTLFEMIANITLDVVGGAIPYVGTVFDAVWKANKRNLELVLEDLLAEQDRRSEEQGKRTRIAID
jgi:Iap family predicted aminopeptidase